MEPGWINEKLILTLLSLCHQHVESLLTIEYSIRRFSQIVARLHHARSMRVQLR